MYILRTSNHTFIKEVGREIVITPDYKDAVTYNAIGDAMCAATMVNDFVGSIIVSVLRID